MSAHQPILRDEIIEALLQPWLSAPPASRSWIIDCTLGGGGHTSGLLERIASSPLKGWVSIVAFDQDAEAIANAKATFRREIESGALRVEHAPFSALGSYDLPSAIGLLADLGFSSDQIEDPKRGLSFLREGPLDMRLGNALERESCWDILQWVSVKELTEVLEEFGEERHARRIAENIVRARVQGELRDSTTEFAELIRRAIPPDARHGRIHPATRSFQALRILVNQELKELDALLSQGIMKVQSRGRIAILSFHSLEDRKVKWAFKEREKQGCLRVLTKKPIEPGDREVGLNPRARSAKLRMGEVIRWP